MVASAIFFLDDKGKPLLSRNYRGDIPMSTVVNFPILLMAHEEDELTVPCFSHEGINYVYISHSNIFLLALTKKNSNVMSILVFLHHIIAVFSEYFKQLEEESIRDNFVIIYELLDEMMDYGIPQITEPKILQEYITQESHELDVQARASNVVTNNISWRPEGIYYKKNELFLDVIESVDMLLSSEGKILRNDIQGKIVVNAYLSGMPALKLGLNDGEKKLLKEAEEQQHVDEAETAAPTLTSKQKKLRGQYVDLEDVKFHQCVELSQFDSDRTISFVPPDGKFELMSYRITNIKAKPLFLVDAKVVVKTHSRVLVHVTAKSQFRKRSVASIVEISIPVPIDADSPRFKTNIGSVYYTPEQNAVVWKIKQFAGGKEYSMTAELLLSSLSGEDDDGNSSSAYRSSGPSGNQPINIKFEIPYLAVSGLQVRYLKVTEPKLKYPSLPWVRYLTQNGEEFAIRMPQTQNSKQVNK